MNQDEIKWGELISCVCPTIGTIAGSLLSIFKVNDGVVYFSHAGVTGADPGFASVFARDEQDPQRIRLYNKSFSSNDFCTLTFPETGQTTYQTVMLNGFTSFDVTDLFYNNAVNDNSDCELTAYSICQTENGDGAQKSGIKLSSQGKEIPVDGKRHSIGSFFDVTLQDREVVVESKGSMALQSLPVLTVQGSGDTGVRLLDIEGAGGEVKVQLPQPLIQGDLVTVEVIASVDTNADFFESIQNDSRFGRFDENLALVLENAPRLNWKVGR